MELSSLFSIIKRSLLGRILGLTKCYGYNYYKMAHIKNIFMKYKIKLCLYMLFLVVFIGCAKNNIHDDVKPVNKMVLAYIAGNNDLRAEAIAAIQQLQRGVKDIDGAFLVFVKLDSRLSYMLKLRFSLANEITADTLKTYYDENSSDPAFLKQVIEDSRNLVPAYSYGLILWSHATSWLPANQGISTKAFGNDGGAEMDLSDLKEAIPNGFEFIAFDACYMGSIEVLYELRRKSKYFISSPSEVLASGFPYQKCARFFFEGLDGLKNVASEYFAFYQNKNGAYSSATISLIDAQYLDDIAIKTKNILTKGQEGKLLNTHAQKLNFQIGSESISSYDFLDLLEKNFDDSEVQMLREVMSKAIIYKANTKFFLNQPLITFSGLSIYYPQDNQDYRQFYNQLSWQNDTRWLK